MAKLKSVNGLAQASNEIKALEAQFTKLEDLEKVAKKINFSVSKKLTPMLRDMLVANYSAAGIGVESGDLKRAVASSYVSANAKGMSIKLGAGFDKKVYVRASVFRKYKGFYQLSGDQVGKLQSEFVRLWQVEVNKMLKPKVGGVGGSK